MASEKRFVYVLSNRSVPRRYYTGLTSDVAARLATHNAGRCTHTANGRPWEIDVVVEFSDDTRAVEFREVFEVGIRRGLREAPSPIAAREAVALSVEAARYAPAERRRGRAQRHDQRGWPARD
jgi:putative endonuclease